MAYKLSWNNNTLNRVRKKSATDTLAFAYAIAREGIHGAPVLTGALINSIRVTDDHNGTIYILAGGSVGGKSVPYAKRREYENKKNPDKRFYMKKAFKWGRGHYKEYYKGVTK